MARGSKKGAPSASVASHPSLMSAIAAATIAGGAVYTSEADRATLNPAFIETNTSMVDAEGKMATRASAAGLASVQPATPAAANGEAAKRVVSAIVNTPIPRPAKSKRGGHIKPIYPFDALEVNGSFFVPANAEMPNPAKSLASSVSSATRRYAVEDLDTNAQKQYEVVQEKQEDGTVKAVNRVKMKKTRQFEVFPMEDGAPWGFTGQAGAGIWRTA